MRTIENYSLVKIETLKTDNKNARIHDEVNIHLIMESLKQHGQKKPIVLNGNMVMAGNGTLEAAKRLGWTEILANTEGFKSVAQARAYAIQDNRTAEKGAWNFEQLGENLKELESLDFDMSGIGFDLNDFVKNEVDYGVLDDEDSTVVDDLRSGTRKAIQIEFELEHYDEAFELVKFWRSKGGYVGMMMMDKLKSEKEKL